MSRVPRVLQRLGERARMSGSPLAAIGARWEPAPVVSHDGGEHQALSWDRLVPGEATRSERHALPSATPARNEEVLAGPAEWRNLDAATPEAAAGAQREREAGN